MKTVIKNLCGKLCDKLRDWEIDPTTLIKSIGIFIALIILIILSCVFPIIPCILLIIATSVSVITLIYILINTW